MIDQIKSNKATSIRTCCAVLGFRPQTYYQRKGGHRPEELDAHIADLLHQVTRRFFWMVFHFLRRPSAAKGLPTAWQGYTWNHKRVYRIWKAEELHLRLPPKRSKISRKYQDLLAPDHINQGWAVDFLSDWVVGPNQEKVRIINIIDEHSRKALWSEAYSGISARVLIEVLNLILQWRGCPAYIRCDN